MIELLTDQEESNQAFRRWANIMIKGSTLNDNHWLIEGTGIVFSNYGWGAPGTIENEVMLGVDPELGSGIVKIVQPKTSKLDKGKLTVIGRGNNGHLFLLREGYLHKNGLSRLIKEDFASLSGMTEVPVFASGKRSERKWFIVADLHTTSKEILAQTAHFTLACARARLKAGGGKEQFGEEESFEFGKDEKGQIIKVTRSGGSTEVSALQGYVYDALKKKVGKDLKKPTKNGYTVDGMIRPAKVLIEIKTGIFAHNIYEAIGQLTLYPSLIGLPKGLAPVLLIPDTPRMKPYMAAALDEAGIEVYTYSIGGGSKAPKIIFSNQLLERCRTVSSS